VNSIELPQGTVSRFLGDATRFAKHIDDALPGGFGRLFKILDSLP